MVAALALLALLCAPAQAQIASSSVALTEALEDVAASSESVLGSGVRRHAVGGGQPGHHRHRRIRGWLHFSNGLSADLGPGDIYAADVEAALGTSSTLL